MITSGTEAIFQKAGLTHEDHHFKNEATGKYEASPPDKLKVLYDYLPRDTVANSHHKTPQKISLKVRARTNFLAKPRTHTHGTPSV